MKGYSSSIAYIDTGRQGSSGNRTGAIQNRMNSLADKHLKHFIGRNKKLDRLGLVQNKVENCGSVVALSLLCLTCPLVVSSHCLCFDFSLIQIDIIAMSSFNEKSESEMLKKVMSCI